MLKRPDAIQVEMFVSISHRIRYFHRCRGLVHFLFEINRKHIYRIVANAFAFVQNENDTRTTWLSHFHTQTNELTFSVRSPLVSVYIKATAGLCIISLIADAIATLLTGFGLRTQNYNLKYKFYRKAVLVMLLACKLFYLFSSLPIQFISFHYITDRF